MPTNHEALADVYAGRILAAASSGHLERATVRNLLRGLIETIADAPPAAPPSDAPGGRRPRTLPTP